MNTENWKQRLKTVARFVANPRLLLCVAVAWVITNGWSYVLFAIGTALQIEWMIAVGGAYLTFLWLPVSPEKLVTVTIAMVLLRWWFPNDQRTLAVLKESYAKTKEAFKRRKERSAHRRQQKQAKKDRTFE